MASFKLPAGQLPTTKRLIDAADAAGVKLTSTLRLVAYNVETDQRYIEEIWQAPTILVDIFRDCMKGGKPGIEFTFETVAE